jgi:hypothetical protein
VRGGGDVVQDQRPGHLVGQLLKIPLHLAFREGIVAGQGGHHYVGAGVEAVLGQLRGFGEAVGGNAAIQQLAGPFQSARQPDKFLFQVQGQGSRFPRRAQYEGLGLVAVQVLK